MKRPDAPFIPPRQRRSPESMPITCDVVVIGAGPAGLAAAAALGPTGSRTVVLDQGRPLHERDPAEPDDLTSGAGGAGLYSDGKFSFFPSATALWNLGPESALRTAYLAFAETLASLGIGTPGFPTMTDRNRHRTVARSEFKKAYPSFYVSPEHRASLVESLQSRSGAEFRFGTKANRISVLPDDAVEVAARDRSGAETVLRAKFAVLATGRFGSLSCAFDAPGHRPVFRRVELGFRIEQPADRFFLRHENGLDPKHIIHGAPGYSWRTFCCCRDGAVVTTRFDRITSVSGRADCPPTGSSSVGFNLRIHDRAKAEAALELVRGRAGHLDAVRSSPVEEFTANRGPLAEFYGGDLNGLLTEGLGRLSDAVRPHSLEGATLTGPTVEGVGFYPLVNERLNVPSFPVWVAGDHSGIFRGITAALVSGAFVGSQIAEALPSQRRSIRGQRTWT